MEDRKVSAQEIADAMKKVSFKTNAGKGARVCYPNEVLHELFGTEIMKKLWINED